MDADLATFARDAASRGDDLYALLAIDALASESDIRRAFRRKALTAHPDKTGDAYDPVYYERLERTRDVLLAADVRKVYDDGMRAVHEQRRKREEMGAHKRRLVEELEARENEAKRAKVEEVHAAGRRDAEVEKMRASGERKWEERQRLKREAEERERVARGPEKKSGEKKQADEAEARTSRAPSPTPKQGKGEGGDDEDDIIAEAKRRLLEKKQQRKAEKKAKKGAAKEPSPPHDSPSTSMAEADGLKQPSENTTEPSSSTSIPHRPSAPPSADPGQDRRATVMARLKAAQAEKRRRAEEEATKATATTEACRS